jgi:hypothetical protein
MMMVDESCFTTEPVSDDEEEEMNKTNVLCQDRLGIKRQKDTG